MANLRQARWVTWPATALLLAACVFPPPPPSLPPVLPVQSSGSRPVLIPTNTPVVANSQATALTLAQQQLLAGLPSLGAASELQNEVWFNSDPLRLADLRGKVVMVEFWTYG